MRKRFWVPLLPLLILLSSMLLDMRAAREERRAQEAAAESAVATPAAAEPAAAEPAPADRALAERAQPATVVAPQPRPPVRAAQPSRAPVRLQVLTNAGAETTVTIDQNTEVLVVASWCPYTRSLNSVLEDPRAWPHVRGRRIVYLFDWNEFDRKATEWVQGGKVAQAQVDAYIARQPPGPRLVDQGFLSQVAARNVYFFDAKHPLKYEGYPAAFSAPPNEFLLNYGYWLDRLMPPALADELLAAHPAGNELGG